MAASAGKFGGGPASSVWPRTRGRCRGNVTRKWREGRRKIWKAALDVGVSDLRLEVGFGGEYGRRDI